MDDAGGRDLHEALMLRSLMVAALACVVACAQPVHAADVAPAAGAAGAPGAAMAPNLTGAMARWRPLIGTWTCAAGTSGGFPVTLTILTAPGNTLQTWVRSPSVSAAGYFGYDDATKAWWSAYTDSLGARFFETSRDGETFTGTMESQQHSMTIRATTTRLSATKFHTLTEERSGAQWVKIADNTCTKS